MFGKSQIVIQNDKYQFFLHYKLQLVNTLKYRLRKNYVILRKLH